MIDLRNNLSVLAQYVSEYYSANYPEGHSPKEISLVDHKIDYTPWLNTTVVLPQWLQSITYHNNEQILRDRAIGALAGLAIADAVGTTLEFSARDERTIHDMVGGGPFNLKPGEWTDDTTMALCLAETYLSKKSLDLTDFRNRMVNWYHFGVNSVNGRCFDIGNATRYALDEYLKFGSEWFGNTGVDSAGNAAIIRLSPCAIFNRYSLLNTLFDAEQQSKATHGAVESLDCSRLLGLILYHLLNGADKYQALSAHIIPLNARTALINAGEYKNKTRDEIRSSGYVIDTLEAALWAVWHTDNFRDAILLAANLGDDADSVAATTGQIAGVLYGYSGIPVEWKEKLAEGERIVEMGKLLFKFSPCGYAQ
ncbi:ADP-ribosylarginine hydrolase Tri1 [Candidatus Pantoea formicae]|uniref:ADP-ribosylarginine hydrolase Tri1 n=1 Tax=Candidatus Pantoea formicae TaxID=2608355 RepID=UPI003ED8C6A7